MKIALRKEQENYKEGFVHKEQISKNQLIMR